MDTVILSDVLYIFIYSSVILVQLEQFIRKFQDNLFQFRVFKIKTLLSTFFHLL